MIPTNPWRPLQYAASLAAALPILAYAAGLGHLLPSWLQTLGFWASPLVLFFAASPLLRAPEPMHKGFGLAFLLLGLAWLSYTIWLTGGSSI